MAIDEDCSTGVPAQSADSAGPGAPPAAPGASEPANPTALTVAQVARMLAIPEEKVREHLAAGAPQDASGQINLVHYAAWLNQRLKELDGDG